RARGSKHEDQGCAECRTGGSPCESWLDYRIPEDSLHQRAGDAQHRSGQCREEYAWQSELKKYVAVERIGWRGRDPSKTFADVPHHLGRSERERADSRRGDKRREQNDSENNVSARIGRAIQHFMNDDRI